MTLLISAINSLYCSNRLDKAFFFVQANLAEHAKLADIVKNVADRFGKLDILVNNAHASKNIPIHETTQADFDLSLNTGFYPTFYFMQAALSYLKETQGKIINFASGASINCDANKASYAAAMVRLH